MITILFFGAIRDQLKCAELELAYNKNIVDVSDVLNELKSWNSVWKLELSRYDLLSAVNHQMVPLTFQVKDDDEVVFFPPLIGDW